MRQERNLAFLLALLVGSLLAMPALAARPHAAKPAAAESKTDSPRKARVAMHQFTGVVTALDENSFTVEKSGKKPKTMTFAKHAEMRTTGTLDQDVRVTVYYRDEGGRSIAHRVVVKTDVAKAKNG